LKQSREILRWLTLQTVMLIIASLCLLASRGFHSFVLGTLCSFIPQIIFMTGIMRARTALLQGTRKSLQWAQTGKLMLTGVLSVLVFHFIRINPVFFFAGFATTYLTFFVAAPFAARRVPT
jgi:F0F1-type ATP synthase assembly protein I